MFTLLGGVKSDVAEIKARTEATDNRAKKLDLDFKGEIARLDQRIDRLEDRLDKHFGAEDAGVRDAEVDGGKPGGRSPDHEKRQAKFCGARCPDSTSTCYVNCERRFDYCADNFEYYSPEFYKCLAVSFEPEPGAEPFAPLPDRAWKSPDWNKPRTTASADAGE
ncbi:MAG: hypothetical protein U0263_35305 [Polyangiaceae bacterium]